MATTLYKEVSYNLKSLVEDIDLGEIALPDLQRPFVWTNAKVRDLFDSMYRGYPVGFLLFWATSLTTDKMRAIGTGAKQKMPRLLVVDGQQRLTSLYAVMRGLEVIRDGLAKEKVQIAFCPKDQTFAVWDAAVGRNPEYIPDISKVWSKDTYKTRFVRDFISTLKQSREVTEQEEYKISDSIDRLFNLENFPFYALELSSNVDEEQVAEVFVRINSQGKTLNQADFILTLMSVFWDEGRHKLESFCLETRKIDETKKGPFNYIIQPEPNNLLRVIISLGFGRGRLKYGYALLRGKDLDSGEITAERRHEQFEKLKIVQEQTLNLTNWHEFLKVPMSAGFTSEDMISSQVGLLFAYTLFLLGQNDFKIDKNKLRKVCAKWLYMSALTSRYTGSPESVIERDIVEFKACKNADAFIARAEEVISSTLTEDFWTITLPNDLATSSTQSPSLYAYQAALSILGAKAMFSNLFLRDLFNPYVRSPRASIERHHLFPRNYLKTLGLTSVRDTNQIANYAWIEWSDNGEISDDPPEKYFPKFLKRIPEDELDQTYYFHALPKDWYKMDYQNFLEERRKLIAKVIRDGFKKIE